MRRIISREGVATLPNPSVKGLNRPSPFSAGARTFAIQAPNELDSEPAKCDPARSMSAGEARTLIQRAREGGYFEEAIERWLDAPSFSAEEADAYAEVWRLAKALVDGAPIPSLDVGRPGFVVCIIGDQEWADHLAHGCSAPRLRETYLHQVIS